MLSQGVYQKNFDLNFWKEEWEEEDQVQVEPEDLISKSQNEKFKHFFRNLESKLQLINKPEARLTIRHRVIQVRHGRRYLKLWWIQYNGWGRKFDVSWIYYPTKRIFDCNRSIREIPHLFRNTESILHVLRCQRRRILW